MKINTWLKKNTTSLSEKTVVITGTTSGLGFETLKILCKLEATIIVGVRNTAKAEQQKAELLKQFPNCQITIFKLDLSELASIKNFVNKIKFLCGEGVDVLINNAGLFTKNRKVLDGGYEQHFFINCIAPLLLTKLLTPLLELKQNSKVVLLGSISCNFTKIDFNDFDFRNCKKDVNAYANSKRWLTIASFKLKDELKQKSIELNLIHPGISSTALFLNSRFNHLQPLLKLIFTSPKKACLNEVAGIFKTTKTGEWIGPRVFNIWGLPKVSVLKFKNKNLTEFDTCYQKLTKILTEFCEM